jgi:hypothetical protein
MAGEFNGTIDFDPGAGVHQLTAARPVDVFVSKLDSDGNFVWARRLGGAEYDYPTGVTVGGDGSVYTVGVFRGTSDFDPGPGTYNLTSVSSFDIFVSKLTNAGNFVWAVNLGPGGGGVRAGGVAVDASGNVYVVGPWMAVFKLNSSGSPVWRRAVAGANGGAAYGVAVDGSGKVCTVGWFSGTADFDPGPDSYYLSSVGRSDAYFWELDSAGDFVWVNRLGDGDYYEGHGVALDRAGNVYAVGIGRNSMAFVSKLDGVGSFVWTKQLGFEDNVFAFVHDYGVALDGGGAVYIAGTFDSPFGYPVDFDPGPGTYDLTPTSTADSFVCKLAQSPFLADLLVTDVSGPTTASANAVVNLEATVNNLGDATGSGVDVAFYLSTDGTLGTSVLVKACDTSALGAGAQETVTCSNATVPPVDPGQYYWVACADSQNVIPESNEENNCGVGGPVTIPPTPDLLLSDVSGPTTTAVGSVVSLGATVENFGFAMESGFGVGFYLSTDTSLGASDVLVKACDTDALDAGAERTVTCSNATVPTVAPGQYYWVVCADYQNELPELNEDNNCGFEGPVRILPEGCETLAVNPSRETFGAAGGNGTVNIIASSVCAWTVTTNSPGMITLISPESGTGNATLSYFVAPNILGRSVTGKLSIFEKVVTVIEDIDTDFDSVGDSVDNCPTNYNPGQEDTDANGVGQVCEDPIKRAELCQDFGSMGRIDGCDLFPLAHAFGSCEGDPSFDYRADLTGMANKRDSCVDGFDLAIMALVWGGVTP